MYKHSYTGKTTAPDLDQIHTDVAASTMTNKNIQYCSWDEGTTLLDIFYDVEVTGSDKTKLDTIITDNS